MLSKHNCKCYTSSWLGVSDENDARDDALLLLYDVASERSGVVMERSEVVMERSGVVMERPGVVMVRSGATQ